MRGESRGPIALAAAAAGVLFALCAGSGAGQAPAPAEDMHAHHHHGHEEHGMTMDAGGMVMNENTDRLPGGCTGISEDVKIVVRAGRKYAVPYPGTMFGYDRGSWDVPPCSRVTVTLVNEDHVRHQWMVHGLPRYLYPGGMFHLEVSGPGEKTGTFIVPAEKKTYLVHCDVAQHMEKGMKGQLTVLGGDVKLPGIPGLTAPARSDRYPVRWDARSLALVGSGLAAGFALAWWAMAPRRRASSRS